MNNENNLKEEVKEILHKIEQFGEGYTLSHSDIQSLLIKLTWLTLYNENKFETKFKDKYKTVSKLSYLYDDELEQINNKISKLCYTINFLAERIEYQNKAIKRISIDLIRMKGNSNEN